MYEMCTFIKHDEMLMFHTIVWVFCVFSFLPQSIGTSCARDCVQIQIFLNRNFTQYIIMSFKHLALVAPAFG